jgi:hypothetical protein
VLMADQQAGFAVPGKGREADRLVRSPRAVGPRLVTCHRNPAVRNGLQQCIVRPARRWDPGKQARVQNPDKDEVPGSSPGRPTNQPSRLDRQRIRHQAPLQAVARVRVSPT